MYFEKKYKKILQRKILQFLSFTKRENVQKKYRPGVYPDGIEMLLLSVSRKVFYFPIRVRNLVYAASYFSRQESCGV